MNGLILRAAFDGVFQARETHVMPTALPTPPLGWAGPYEVLAEPLGIESDLSRGHARAADFLDPVLGQPHHVQGLVWNPISRNWSNLTT